MIARIASFWKFWRRIYFIIFSKFRVCLYSSAPDCFPCLQTSFSWGLTLLNPSYKGSSHYIGLTVIILIIQNHLSISRSLIYSSLQNPFFFPFFFFCHINEHSYMFWGLRCEHLCRVLFCLPHMWDIDKKYKSKHSF